MKYVIDCDTGIDDALDLALDPSLDSYEEKNIEISLEDRGRCMVGFGLANARVYTSLNSQGFFYLFKENLENYERMSKDGNK